MDEDNPITKDIPVDDATPSVVKQSELNGWNAAYYHFGKLEGQGTDYFNPALIERPDGPWLITRASGFHEQGFMYGQNAIIAFKLDDACKQPHHGKILRWPVDDPKQHFEDPRAFYFPEIDQTAIGACTFMWNGPGDWTGPHQAFGTFDHEWMCKKMNYPEIGGNPGSMEKILEHKNYEKNWLWFLYDNRLHLLYKANPWLVIGFGNTWTDKMEYKGISVSWPHGEIRGGTAPVKVGEYYWTFHHSSLPWKGRYRRYYAGALAFDAEPPFTPKLITHSPLLQGSQNDTWAQHKPLVIFPCGAIYRNGTWIVSCGVNDMKSAWVEIPHDDLVKRMVPIVKSGASIFDDIGIPQPILSTVPVLAESQRRGPDNSGIPDAITDEVRESTGREPLNSDDSRIGAQTTLEKRRAALVKARAARAEKRKARNHAYFEALRIAPEAMDEKTMGQFLKNHPELVIGKGTFKVKRLKRRRRRTKSQMAEARAKALQEYEARKIYLAPKDNSV